MSVSRERTVGRWRSLPRPHLVGLVGRQVLTSSVAPRLARMLLGRDHERAQIASGARRGAIGDRARRWRSCGEPGIGKTALLDHAAAQRRRDVGYCSARGVQSEAADPVRIPARAAASGALSCDQLAAPRRSRSRAPWRCARPAYRSALPSARRRSACSPRTPTSGPVAVLVDDAHWLDGSSAQALLFAFRRLLADPIAAVLTVREGEPSLLDGSDLPTLRIGGLTEQRGGDAAAPGSRPSPPSGCTGATAGNPLALLELASEADDLALAPEGAPLLRLRAHLSAHSCARTETLDPVPPAWRWCSWQPAESGDLATARARRAEARTSTSATLASAESAGLIAVRGGSVAIPPSTRAVRRSTADDTGARRRDAHRALAASLPDRDVDRRAWHLAAAAVGTDESASVALEQAAHAARRAARTRRRPPPSSAPPGSRQSRPRASDICSGRPPGGMASRPCRASRRAARRSRATTRSDPIRSVEIDRLAGHIATRRGPVMRRPRDPDRRRRVGQTATATRDDARRGRLRVLSGR